MRLTTSITLFAAAGAGVEAFSPSVVGSPSTAQPHLPVVRPFSRRSRAAAIGIHPGDDIVVPSPSEDGRLETDEAAQVIEEVGLEVRILELPRVPLGTLVGNRPTVPSTAPPPP